MATAFATYCVACDPSQCFGVNPCSRPGWRIGSSVALSTAIPTMIVRPIPAARRQESAAGDDRGVYPRASADHRERKEERKDDETEPRQREQRPARARIAQRDHEARKGIETVRGPESPPGDGGKDDEQDEERETLS